MKLRDRAPLLILCLALGGIGWLPVQAQPQPPNFVVLVLDDLGTQMPYWDALARTRGMLKAHAMTFNRAYGPARTSAPARASILTGKYGHNTGVITNKLPHGSWLRFEAQGNEQRTVARYLQDAGYRTALVGKYMPGYEIDPTHVPPGWSTWRGATSIAMYDGYGYEINQDGTLVEYGHAEADYFTDVVAGMAEEFVRATESDDSQPFFLLVAPTAPHWPLPPAPRHASHPWVDTQIPARPNYFEADLSSKPAWLRFSAPHRGRLREATVADYRDRMGTLLAVDELFARLVTALEAGGELDNTYLILVSDDGWMLGAHWLTGKMPPYEEAAKVPLVIGGPGIAPGSEDDHLVLLTDLMPTILELAGAAIPDDVDGRSLVPLLTAQAAPDWRTDFLIEYRTGVCCPWDDPVKRVISGILEYAPSYRALHTEEMVFVRWFADDELDGGHDYELYHLPSDPYQLHNLLATPEGRSQYEGIFAELAGRLHQLEICAGASCRQ